MEVLLPCCNQTLTQKVEDEQGALWVAIKAGSSSILNTLVSQQGNISLIIARANFHQEQLPHGFEI